MKKRRLIVLLAISAIAIVAFVACLVFPSSPPEPSYGGHPLSYWLLINNPSIGGTGRVGVTHMVLRNMGTNAVPYLLECLQYGGFPEQPWKTNILRLVQKMPLEVQLFVLRRTHRESLLHSAAKDCFYMLSPEARVLAISELSQMMHDPEPSKRMRAAIALDNLGEAAILLLLSALQDKNPIVRLNAAIGLSHMVTKAAPAFEVLQKALNDSDFKVRVVATNALRRIGAVASTSPL